MRVGQAYNARTLARTPGAIRRAAKSGEVLPLTFHHRITSWVVPDGIWKEALEALEEKRAREAQQERREVAA